MSRRQPWEDITTPDSDYNVLLTGGVRSVPVYWGKDTSGQCLLIVELEGEHNAQFTKDRITINGIGIDLRQKPSSSRQQLVLSLEKHVNRDLFFGLCETLVGSLDPVTEPAVALAVSLRHLKRWKLFLAGRDPRLMSPEEVRGLFAELQFLRTLLDGRLQESDAVQAWHGPDKAQHDFSFGNTSVEIKSLTGNERNSVRISSEDQLESLNDDLFLRIYRLSAMPESDRAVSLNELVQAIEGILTDSLSVDRFHASLAAYGYVYMLDYDMPRFVVSETRTYEVIEGFPRLIRSALPEGVARVGYDVKLESIDTFLRADDDIFGGI